MTRLSVFGFCLVFTGCAGMAGSAADLGGSNTADLAGNPAADLGPPVPPGTGIHVNTAAAIQAAMQNAVPGDIIVIAPGTYQGSPTSVANAGGSSPVNFYGSKSGTAAAPITIESEDPNLPAVLQGSGTASGSGYTLYITGDYWQIKNLKVTGGSKGIMFDHAHYCLISAVEVYGTGDEAIHLRDGSSNNVVDNVNVHDTGIAQPDYSEGFYVGSFFGTAFNQASNDNTLKNSHIGPNIHTKEVNLQPGATGNVVDNCTFDATGMTGNNSGYSFISIKGPSSVVQNSTFQRNGNAVITDAVAVSYSASTVSNNTFYLDDMTAYVVKSFSGGSTTTANNTRIPAGNMYH